jgi:cytochrome c biogenesis protein CcdA
VSSRSSTALNAARSRLAIRRQLATTPGRLRLAGVLVTLSAIVFGVVAIRAADTRAQAVSEVRATELRLAQAVEISANLSDAHATTARSFLGGEPETAQSRAAYKRALRQAGAGVADLAGELGTSAQARPEIRRLVHGLPEYSGLIDDARANFRQGFPVAGAYLRRAANTLRDELLPSANRLYAVQARSLTASYRSGVDGRSVLYVLVAGITLLAVLAGTQVYVARATRRLLNLRLALATALLLGLLGWIVVASAVQSSALERAQRQGSDPIELLTATRILASRAQGNESIALSARGGGEGESSIEDIDQGFLAVTTPIEGLLRQVEDTSDAARRSVTTIRGAYGTYLDAHDRVVTAERNGDFTRAAALAVRDRGSAGAPSSTRAARALDAALVREARAAQRRFDEHAADAGSAVEGLSSGIPLLSALCALLALSGIRRRLDEYR